MRFLLILAVLLCGCAKAREDGSEAAAKYAGDKMSRNMAGESDAAFDSEGSLPDSGAIRRKIIYTYDVELVVEDFDEIPKKVDDLVARFGGYVANSNVYGSPGSPRRGQWTLRVPENRHQEFLVAVKKLGEVRRAGSDSQDVTEEYYDVAARLKNKEAARDRLLKHLDSSTGKLDDIVKVEREIDRVQELIDGMQGRLKVLDELTALTTFNLNIDEVKDYVPEEAATYGTRLRRRWTNSISTLNTAAQSFSIGAIVALPWIGVFLAPVIVLWLIFRTWRKRRG